MKKVAVDVEEWRVLKNPKTFFGEEWGIGLSKIEPLTEPLIKKALEYDENKGLPRGSFLVDNKTLPAKRLFEFAFGDAVKVVINVIFTDAHKEEPIMTKEQLLCIKAKWQDKRGGWTGSLSLLDGLERVIGNHPSWE